MDRANGRSHTTRRRLLEAGLEVFARDGFRGATIERICRRAGANIAAAHYHFGDKRRLYAAVFADAERRALATGPAEASTDGTPEETIRAHVAFFLHRLLDPNRPAWMAQLLAHELLDPTPALDRIVRRRMRANHEQIAAAIRELAPGARPDAVRMATLSVIAQCVFYRHSAAIISRLYPDFDPAREVEHIADHITRFSIAGLASLRARRRDSRP